MNLPRISVIGLGGTIASGATSGTGGVVPSLTAADLLAAIPQLSGLAEIEAGNFANLPSTEIDLELLMHLAEAIREKEAQGFAGVVITQGTDTIEETSYALDLLLDCNIPVVVTGAMRNPTMAGIDGPGNLFAAILTALAPEYRDQGVLVVLDDVIHAAAWVQKRDTSSTGAFWSPSPSGWVAEGRAELRCRFPRRPKVQPASAVTLFVPILKPGLWDSPLLVNLAVENGADALVLDLAGGGHVSARWVDALERAAAKVPVIFASRTRGGRVLSRTYGQAGAELDLQRRGLFGAGDLDALKARLAITLLLLARQPERFAQLANLSVRTDR